MKVKEVEIIDIPVIKASHVGEFERFVGVEGLEKLSMHQIYKAWERLSMEEKEVYKDDFNKVLEPRSLVYVNKTRPNSIDPKIKLQYDPVLYDWEDTDYISSLERMHWIYEPVFWKSYQQYRKSSIRPLFLGLINWERPKLSTKEVVNNIVGVMDWLEYLDIPSSEVKKAMEEIASMNKTYINPTTNQYEPRITLWAFFTQDQNPARYTRGKFKALKQNIDLIRASKDIGVDESLENVDESFEIVLDEIPENIPSEDKLQSDIFDETIEDLSFEGIPPLRDEPIKEQAEDKDLYFNIGKDWKFRGKDKFTDILNFQGRIANPKSRSKRQKIKEQPTATLRDVSLIYKKNYLLPPLKRAVTTIFSEEDLQKAIEELEDGYW